MIPARNRNAIAAIRVSTSKQGRDGDSPEAQKELESVDERIAALRGEAEMVVNKLKVLTNDTALKYMEKDLERIEKKIATLELQKEQKGTSEDTEIEQVFARVKYFLENLDELLLKQRSQVKKALFFKALFTKLPNYKEINPGNKNSPLFTGVNPLISLLNTDNSLMVIPRGVEPRLPG